MAGTPLAGKSGRIQVGGINLNLSKWRIKLVADDLPNRNFESGGYDEGITGFRGAEIEFSGIWDAGQTPHVTAGPNLREGEILTNVYLYVAQTGSRRYEFPSVRLLEVNVEVEAEGMVKLTGCRFKTNSTYTYAN